MAAYSVDHALAEFHNILKRLHGSQRDDFCQKVRETIGECNKEDPQEDKILRCIAEKIRGHPDVPVSAVLNTESTLHPAVGEFSDLEPCTVISVDNFLYEDDDAIDDLCEQGLISRNYCLDCGSHKTAPLNFISHSASLQQLKFLFQHALPDLHGKTLVDVGSRLGAILYGVVCADVTTQGDLLKQADVIILHNVFEFFASLELQVKIWKFLRDTIQSKGGIVVTVPSLEESLEHLQVDISLDSWVKKLPVDCSNFSLPNEDDRDQLESICLYEVIG